MRKPALVNFCFSQNEVQPFFRELSLNQEDLKWLPDIFWWLSGCTRSLHFLVSVEVTLCLTVTQILNFKCFG